jgi:hypothetical protein
MVDGGPKGDDARRNRWLDGSQVMAVLLDRLSGGKPVRITREDVERVNGGTTHPVVFTIHEGGEVLELHNQLPNEPFTSDDLPKH